MKKLILICSLSILTFGYPALHAQLPEIDKEVRLRIQTLPAGEKILSWTGEANHTFFIQASPDLIDWTWAPNIEPGLNGPMSYEVDGPTAKGFFRLARTPQTAADPDTADFDGDGLGNLYEITPRARPGGIAGHAGLNPNIQTNPIDSDTDHDGLTDKWEQDHGLDPTDNGSRDPTNGPNGDADGDGIPNWQEQADGSDPIDASSAADHSGQGDPFRPRWSFRIKELWADSYGAEFDPAAGKFTTFTVAARWQNNNDAMVFNNDTELSQDHPSGIQDFENLEAPYLSIAAVPWTNGLDDYPYMTAYGEFYRYGDDPHFTTGYWNRKADLRLNIPKAISHDVRQNVLKITGHRVALEEFTSWQYDPYEQITVTIPAGETKSSPVELRPPVLDGQGTLIELPSVTLVSRDRYFAGEVPQITSAHSIELEFINTTTGENLGYYTMPAWDDPGTAKVYDSVTDILSNSDTGSNAQPASQKVWFVRNDSNVICFYSCFSQLGEVSVKLRVDGQDLTTLHHTLTAAKDFSDIIDYVDAWVKGKGFISEGSGAVLAMNAATTNITTSNGAAPEMLDWLVTPCLIPFFSVIQNVEGLSAVAIGLFDGVKTGLTDDWEFCKLVGYGIAAAGSYACDNATAELHKWRTDPMKRAREFKQFQDKLVEEVIFRTVASVQALHGLYGDLTTWEGWRKRAWSALEFTRDVEIFIYTIDKSVWTHIVDGLTDWMDDFCGRMEIGAEKAHWTSAPWMKNKLIAALDVEAGPLERRASYTFGYSFGYICEQVAIGALTAEGANIAKVAVKGGVSLGGALSLRTAAAVAESGQLLKKYFASAAVSVEMKAGAERGFAEAASGPISAEFKDAAAEATEATLRRGSFNREVFNYQVLNEEVFNCPRIQKLFLSPGMEARFYKASGQLCKLMGEEASAPALKGWVKAYDRCLKFEGVALLDDRAEDLFQLVKIETTEGKKALRKSLEEFGATDGSGKFWLRDVEKIQAEGYRYSNFDPRFDANGNPVSGPPKLATSEDGGWYASFEKLDESTAAKGHFQLPDDSTAKFRLEFDWEAVKDHVRMPRGKHHDAEWFEFLAKDYPENGLGGGTQVVIDGGEVPIKKIWDISGAIPIPVYP